MEMEMRMRFADRDECSSCRDDEWWNELPQDVQEDALAWLPTDSLITYRRVCMEWNALLSSTKFLGGLSVEAPVNRKPWLVVWQEDTRQPCQVYCFYRKKWVENFFLSFLSRDDEEYWRGSVLAKSEFGRLAVRMWDPTSGFSYHVCNPYTQTSIKLPPLPLKRVSCVVMFEGEAAINNNNKNRPDIYNVVVLRMGNGAYTSIVEIYDSRVKSWRLVGHIPENLDARYQMIFFNGYFYYFVMERRPVRTPMILIFSIHDGGEMRMWVEPMPQFLRDSGRHMSRFITCGSRLLMLTAQIEPNGLLIIWEFHKHSSNPSWWWREIVRMPASLRERLDFDSGIRCQGVDNCVCFISVCGTAQVEVLVYNLNENSWNWIASCPLRLEANKAIRSMAFQARPDMKVG